ncbi:ROK family protein [Microbacterium sp.]|uniref:ROK family protein n=1 Tax=Microbacterium sp. TaxID=51671 RepID=UPI003A86F645
MTGPARVVAVDVGGTSMRASVVDDTGRSGAVQTRLTPVADGPDAVVDAVLDLATTAAAANPGVAAVGLVVPGIVDTEAGVAVNAENLGWRDVPFRQMLSDRVGLPVGFEHDVRGAGRLERRWGAAAGPGDVLFAPVGTGIAGTIWHEGRLLRGGYVGEIGHIDIGTGERCACGSIGCVETVATAAAAVRRYRRRTGIHLPGAADVLIRARRGDADAAAVWAETVDGLAAALIAYVTILAPERIVIGGGLSEAGDALFTPLRERLFERLAWRRPPELVPGAFRSHAGRFGAAMTGFDAAGIPAHFTPTGEDPRV